MTTSIYNISNYSIHSNKTPIESKFTLFLENSFNVHNTLFDYSKVNYINNNIKVEIVCQKHGSFWQRPDVHIHGSGCKQCQSKQTSRRCRKSTEQFVEKSKNKFDDTYDYSKVNYKTNSSKVEICCPKHGSFFQSPSTHLKGHGCPTCSKDLYGYGWYTPKNAVDANNICYLYTIKLTSNEETFYKIGITDNLIRRHNRIHNESGYNVEIIESIISTKYDCNLLEKLLLKNKQRKSKYIPEIKFIGWTECFY